MIVGFLKVWRTIGDEGLCFCFSLETRTGVIGGTFEIRVDVYGMLFIENHGHCEFYYF